MKNRIKNFTLLLFFIFTSAIAIEDTSKDTYLAERVAAGNDWIIDKGQQASLLKPFTWLTSRTMSLTLFPLCTSIDMAILTAKQIHEIPYVLLTNNASHLKRYQKNAQALTKCSLGLLTAPIGVLSPDIVTHHFVPNHIPTSQIIPYGKLYSTHAHVVYPESISDIQSIITEAKDSGKTISILGKSMSQGKQAISNKDWNVAINTSKLNQIWIDPILKIAKVQAGASWGDLQREANEYGLAVRVMQASNIFSIGGSISVNCHGWDYKTGSLRNTLISLTIVDAEGKVLQITPNDPLFDYIVGGYGGFGVLVDATMSLTDNVAMVENGIEVLPSDYLNYFNQYIRHNPAIDMHLYRLSLQPKRLFQTGIAVNYQRTSNDPLIANLINEPERGTRMNRIKMHTLRRLSWLRNTAWNIEKKSALKERVSTRNEFMRPPINPVFNNSNVDTEWLQEYFVKEENLIDFIKFLGNILQKNNVALFNASVRFVKHDNKTKLSYAEQGDRFAIVLFFNQKLSSTEVQKTKVWVQQVIDYLIAHEGSYYLPYQHFATQEQFKACYPNCETVIAYKQMIDPNGLFDNGLYADYINTDVQDSSLFRKVFSRINGQRNEVRDFLNNIFMQLDEKKFFILVDTILENPELDDEQIYTNLYHNIGQAKPNMVSGLQSTLKSLKTLKNDLGDQTAELVGQRIINGYVEIGYPGRMTRPLKNRIKMQGPFYTITDSERLTDYIEAGFPRPYDQFIAINDYAPISSEIPSESVDLVCMYIGLHHIPNDKIDAFITSIKRILRPGGSFILMDHDAHTIELQNFVNIVHSIFNAATGVTPEENNKEIRHFNSLQHWINLLKSHGMIYYTHDPLIRNGDSTLNSLIRFDKPQLESELTLDLEHNRPQIQTYLTAPEWQNVRAAQRYAAFLENEPAYRYPYFSEISGFWKVYGKSWQAAEKATSFSEVAFSEYNLMNIFVGTTMTLEYGAKGLIAAPFALIDKTFNTSKTVNKKSPVEKERLRSLKEYGDYIENTPFYQYPYFQDIRRYWNSYLTQNNTLGSRIKGLFVGTGMTVEYTLKGLLSAPMSYLYTSEAMKEEETIHLIIKDTENIIETIDPSIVVLETFPEELKHIEMPRYMRFTELMHKIASNSCISCVNIAGHDKIQIDVKSLKGTYPLYLDAQAIYEIPAPTDPNYTYTAMEVDVEKLCEVIRALEKNNAKIIFIHDY